MNHGVPRASSDGPNIPHWFDQRYLVLATWGFPVLAVWGFNARWLPVFLGLQQPSGRCLVAALSLCAAGVLSSFCGYFPLAAGLLVIASSTAIASLNVFQPSQNPPKTQGVLPRQVYTNRRALTPYRNSPAYRLGNIPPGLRRLCWPNGRVVQQV
jgi:hypothetical protein